jgi:hypothetical protein
MSLRLSRRRAASVPVHAVADRSLRLAAVGPAARPHRSHRHGRSAAGQRAHVRGRRRGRADGRHPGAGGAGAGDSNRQSGGVRGADECAPRPTRAAVGLCARSPERTAACRRRRSPGPDGAVLRSHPARLTHDRRSWWECAGSVRPCGRSTAVPRLSAGRYWARSARCAEVNCRERRGVAARLRG